jgi:hypothetical protein
MAEGIYDIPSGPKNLKDLFPDIVWETIDSYWIEALEGGTTLGTSPLMRMGCCCSDDDVVVHFMNSLGKFDSMPFQKPNITHDTKSSSLYTPLSESVFDRKASGFKRFNVSANDTYEAKNVCINESDLFWVQELFDSPLAFLQYNLDEQFDPVGETYLPINIVDNSFAKEQSDYKSYILTIKFTLSNSFFIQRN